MCLAIPGEILSVSGDTALERTGKIRYGTIEKEASLAFVPEAAIGDYVLIHAGIAISIVREEDAMHLFKDLDDINEVR
jgi:hydrogenase expression/formation protein HypC